MKTGKLNVPWHGFWRLTMLRNVLFFIFKGILEVNEVLLGLTICPWHRERFGIRWRSCKKNCSCPSEWASHTAVKFWSLLHHVSFFVKDENVREIFYARWIKTVESCTIFANFFFQFKNKHDTTLTQVLITWRPYCIIIALRKHNDGTCVNFIKNY